MNILKNLLHEHKEEIIFTVTAKIDEVIENVNKLITRVDRLEETCTSLKRHQFALEQELEILKKTGSTSNIDEIIDEMEQRQYRANSLIMFGLPERMDGTVDERHQHDNQEIKKVVEFLDVQNVDIINCKRIGKAGKDGTRMSKVVLNTVDKRREILKHAKSLKNYPHGNIFIKPDLTLRQQSQQRELWRQIKERRDRGEDVYINRGKIMSRHRQTNFRVGF